MELGQYVDFSDVPVDAIGHRNINEPELATNRYSGFSPVFGKRKQPCPLTTTQDHAQYIFHFLLLLFEYNSPWN